MQGGEELTSFPVQFFKITFASLKSSAPQSKTHRCRNAMELVQNVQLQIV